MLLCNKISPDLENHPVREGPFAAEGRTCDLGEDKLPHRPRLERPVLFPETVLQGGRRAAFVCPSEIFPARTPGARAQRQALSQVPALPRARCVVSQAGRLASRSLRPLICKMSTITVPVAPASQWCEASMNSHQYWGSAAPRKLSVDLYYWCDCGHRAGLSN